MTDCPTDDDLAAFLNESLTPERLTDIAVHVDGCSRCQGRLDESTAFTGNIKDDASAPIHIEKDRPQSFGAILEPDTSEVEFKAKPNPKASLGTLLMGPMPVSETQPSELEVHPNALPQVPGFEVMSELGRGGMGVVYKAKHRGLSRPVALKMILAGVAADPRTVQRFLFEAEVLARVQHPQVVQVFEVNTYRGPDGLAVPYLAMELLEGGALSDRLEEGPLPVREAAELIEGIARAVHATHVQGIIHRDLKPGNILFAKPDDRTPDSKARGPVTLVDTDVRLPPSSALPKVCDFGLAKFSESGADLTASGQVMGTPHYMAPEQATGDKRLGPPVDVYALGAILFECLAGRRPFEGTDPMVVLLKTVREPAPAVRSLRPEVPRDLEAVVARCLEKDPRRRYQSAEELANDLRRFLENRPTIARPLRPIERLWLWTKRNPTVAGLTFSLVGVLILMFALVTSLWMRAESTAEDERWQRELARRSERTAIAAGTAATKSLEEAKQQRLIADRRQSELVFARAVSSCEEGRVSEGLESFTQAAALADATENPDLARVAQQNHAAWSRELPPTTRALPHTQQPRLAVFHPDGKHLAVACRNSELILWDFASGQKVRTYKPAPDTRPPLIGVVTNPPTFWMVDISPDGKTIAVGAAAAAGSGRITVWDTDSAQPRLAFDATPENENVFAVAFAPDGTLWSTDLDGIRHWDVSGAKPIQLGRGTPPKGIRSIINILVVSPDGRFVYTGDRNGLVREWDTKTRMSVRQWGTGGWTQDLAISPDSTRLAITGPTGKVRVVDLTGKRVPFDIDLGGAYGNGVGFSLNRPVLVSTDRDGNVRFWHRDTGQPVGNPLRLSGEVSRMRFRANSDQFALCAGDSVHLGEVPKPPDVVTPGRGTRIRGLDFSPKADRVGLTDDNFIDVYDAKTLRQIQFIDPSDGALTLKFDSDPARSRLFRGLRGGFDVLEVPDGTKVQTIPAFGMGPIHRIDFSPNVASMYVLGENYLGRYDAKLDRLTLERPSKDVPQGVWCEVMAIRPDSSEVLVGYGRHVVFLHSQTLKTIRPGWAAGDDILDARYTPDSDAVLVGRRDNMAELLNATTGERLGRSMPHARAVTSVAISPDGTLFLTGSRDGTARFWDAKTGLPLGPPLRHSGPVTHVAFASTGTRVATGTALGQVALWGVPAEK